MPRQRKSVDLHRLQGTFQPIRHGPGGTHGTGKPVRPPGMPAHVVDAWRFLVKHADARLTRDDVPILEAAAYLLSQIRKDPDKASISQFSQYRSYLRELRLTAATRTPAPEALDDSWDI